jgi:TRAP-type C4-dicarboxylate transport system permease small subunit
MNWFDDAVSAAWQVVTAAFASAMMAVFAGVLAKHSLEVMAKRTPFLGPMLYAKLPTGFFLYYVAAGLAQYTGIEGDVRNAVAALIGMAGPELVLWLLLRAAKARGIISDLPPDQAGQP